MFNYQLVQLIPQVVGTRSPSMPVIHPEEGAARPVSRLLELRLNDVQDDRDAVLVVVADDALMRVGCI